MIAIYEVQQEKQLASWILMFFHKSEFSTDLTRNFRSCYVMKFSEEYTSYWILSFFTVSQRRSHVPLLPSLFNLFLDALLR